MLLYFTLSLFKHEASSIVSCMGFCSNFLPALSATSLDLENLFSVRLPNNALKNKVMLYHFSVQKFWWLSTSFTVACKALTVYYEVLQKGSQDFPDVISFLYVLAFVLLLTEVRQAIAPGPFHYTFPPPGTLTFPLSGLCSEAIFSGTPFLAMRLNIVVLNPAFFFSQVSSVIALITNLYLPTILFPNSIHWTRM